MNETAALSTEFQAHHSSGEPQNIPEIGKYQDIGVAVTNSGFMNAIMEPNRWQKDRVTDKEKDMDFFLLASWWWWHLQGVRFRL